jgi:hypothetical protein
MIYKDPLPDMIIKEYFFNLSNFKKRKIEKPFAILIPVFKIGLKKA